LPLAWVNIQTSFRRGFPEGSSSELPANRMILFEVAYTNVDPLRSRGNVNCMAPTGAHFGLAAGLSGLIPAIRARKANTISVTLEIIFVFIMLRSRIVKHTRPGAYRGNAPIFGLGESPIDIPGICRWVPTGA